MSDGFVVEKVCYLCLYVGMIWEVDEFFGVNVGLVVVEIEL